MGETLDDFDRGLELPQSWAQPSFDEVFDAISINGKKIKQRDYQAHGLFPVIDQGEEFIGGYTDNIDAIIEIDDPVIVFGDHTRKFKFVKRDFAPGADGVKVLSPSVALIPEFSFYACLALRLPSRGYARHFSILKKHRFPVAPLNEQRRIVEKIEALFAQLDQGEAALHDVQKLLNRYRQSVLKAAVTGALTADWRAENAHCLEHGRDLLERILQARRENWQGRGKYKEPMGPDTNDLPELPKEWSWATLDQLVSGRPRSMQSGPFGSNLKHSEFQREGVLVVGIDNVRDGWFSMGSENRISYEKYRELEKYAARPGDLLVTVMASLGRTCVVPDDLETAIITKHIYRISTERALVSSAFFNMVLQAEWVSRRHMFENSQGQTRPGLNSSILRALPVPLPSCDEQEEILRRVTIKMAEIEQLEKVVKPELTRSAALRQSILKDAFAGKLVPQDPSDEPAAELLARIRAERSANPPKRMRRGATA